MTTTINASTSAGLVQTADTSGALALQTAGTTALSISASQVVTLTNALAVTSGGTGVTTSTGTGANVLGTSPTIATPTITGQATIPTINLTGGQIAFPATQSASSDANTLDDYEEGTWTPVFVPATGSITTQSGSGRYTKIGNMVILTGTVTVTTWGTAGGSVNVTSLPFGFADNFSGNGSETNLNGKQCSARWNGVSSTQFAFNYYDNGGPATVGGNGASFNFSATYRT
jgi:hypothetical protein